MGDNSDNRNKRFSGLSIIFRSLKYSNFRLYFGGQSISLIGTWIQRVALPWLVYELTGSVVLLGIVGFASQIPSFLLTSFAGVIIDRQNRYRILMITQVLSMIQALLLAILFYSGLIEIWHIIALSVFLGCINAFDMPVRQSFLIEMVDRKEDLGNAIALNSTMVNGARLIGPSVAGLLIATSGEGICFLINGVSYLLVIASLLRMKITPRKITRKDTNVLSELKEGFAYTFGFAPISAVILLLGLVSLMGMSYSVLLPVFAREILQGGSHTFGFLMGASGLGALTGALYLATRKSVLEIGRIIPFSAILFGIGLIAFSMSRSLMLSLPLMMLAGLGMMLQMASTNTIIQTIVDDDKRGRVMSFYTMAFMGTAPFGSLLAGWLAKGIGAPSTLVIGGISCIAGAIVFAWKLPTLKKAVRPIYIRLGIINEVVAGIQSATDLTAPPEE